MSPSERTLQGEPLPLGIGVVLKVLFSVTLSEAKGLVLVGHICVMPGASTRFFVALLLRMTFDTTPWVFIEGRGNYKKERLTPLLNTPYGLCGDGKTTC